MKAKLLSFLPLGMLLAGQAHAVISYSIDLSAPEHHLARVEAHFPAVDGKDFKVNLPVWRTGRYQQLPLADGVRLFEARDSDGKLLPWQRTASGEWQISVASPTDVTVSYQLYANELELRVRHIDASHAFLDASGVFVYNPERRDEPLTVNLKVPKGWQSYSGMATGGAAHSFAAANYDVLVDSPIETGLSQQRSFSVDGRDYELVVWGEGNYSLDTMVADLEALATQAKVIWDDVPFKRYVYMVHATSGAGGATEHINSTIIQLPRFMFRERADYLKFITTASHEFIHTWNVKAYRPSGLVPYDFQKENLTDLLWMAEGSTSYFQAQLLLRAKVMTPKEFLEDLAKRIDTHLNTPGRQQQSVAEASLNEWVAQGGDYAINHSVNIYSEGFLASLALDFSLLQDSKLKHSYRDVHRRLYSDFALPKSYGSEDIKTILGALSGKDYGPWWQQHIQSPLALNFDELLSRAGLRLSYGKEPKFKPKAGMVVSGNSLVLESVQRDSAAWQAGLVAGDELLAINDLKLVPGTLDKRLGDFKPGDSIKVSFFHADALQQRTLTLEQMPDGKAEVVAVDKPGKEQKAFFKAWTGIDWPFDANGDLPAKP
ncbi:M61 family metallopeptidase [Shewanella cyperi]|uniref:M61 family metallopeptidase n=1 Tax=Shewanella cyperi TaxID=2814292 RepID=UPI001D186FEC|nr:M61 family peptidase [Shewanella cyperi]